MIEGGHILGNAKARASQRRAQRHDAVDRELGESVEHDLHDRALALVARGEANQDRGPGTRYHASRLVDGFLQWRAHIAGVGGQVDGLVIEGGDGEQQQPVERVPLLEDRGKLWQTQRSSRIIEGCEPRLPEGTTRIVRLLLLTGAVPHYEEEATLPDLSLSHLASFLSVVISATDDGHKCRSGSPFDVPLFIMLRTESWLGLARVLPPCSSASQNSDEEPPSHNKSLSSVIGRSRIRMPVA
jgi:hypothetical protein